jgi:hypothetical protein
MRGSRLHVTFRCLALLAAFVVAVPAPATATSAPRTDRTIAAPTAGETSVSINAGAEATNNPIITVGIAPPPNSAGQVRLSNDGLTWEQRPYAATVSWSITDPATGGVDEDGSHHVYVEYGANGTWTPAGSDTIVLDRVAPDGIFTLGTATSSTTQASWKISLSEGGFWDNESGLAGAYRMAIDGGAWSPWANELDVPDLRLMDYGGSWKLGTRTVSVQFKDLAGNVRTLTDSINVTQPPLTPDQGTVPVRFSFPAAPVTGQLFTIKPVYPPGFVVPANVKCGWRLHWGDEQSLYGLPNENFGEIIIERPATNGACGEWTFTLPWVPAPRFSFSFNMLTIPPGEDRWGYGTAIIEHEGYGNSEFTAAIGSTSPHVTSSSIPLVYLLPESTISQTGDPVTYRLHASGGLPIPQTGQFWAYPTACDLNPHYSQTGGATFTYTPKCSGNWVTGWTGTYKGGYMRSQYDPVADGAAPTVAAPVVRLNRASFVGSVPVVVTWSGKDSGSGVYQYQLQRSVNGGAWSAVALPSRLTTTLKTSVSPTGTTRYRVRARDKVGNWSAWKYGTTGRATTYQDTYAGIKWTGSWVGQSGSAWSGGSARTSWTAGSTASLTFDGRGIGWVTRRGPTRGLVRVWIDGVLAATVDLRSSTFGYRTVLFERAWASAGLHTIKIQNLGTVGSSGADLDAFVVLR